VGVSISQNAPGWARCCQGAEEVDGIVFNDFRGHLVARFDGDEPSRFAIYFDVTEPSLFWEAAQECPLCGHRWARPSEVRSMAESDAGAREPDQNRASLPSSVVSVESGKVSG
jgi:hypothetical protein